MLPHDLLHHISFLSFSMMNIIWGIIGKHLWKESKVNKSLKNCDAFQEFYLKNLRSQVFLWIFFEFPDVLFKTGAQPCRLPTMSIYCFSLTSASFSSTQETVMALKCHFCKYLPTSCRSLLLRCACCNKEVKKINYFIHILSSYCHTKLCNQNCLHPTNDFM